MKCSAGRYFFKIVVALLLGMTAKAQAPVLPQARKILSSKDFKGTPDEKENFLARTYTVISIKYAISGPCPEKGKTRLRAETAIGVSEKSWMKLNRIRSRDLLAELLSHEQGHYDIGEVFAMDLKNRLSDFCFEKDRLKLQADSIFTSMSRYYDGVQRRYDEETDYMRDREMQVKWKKRITAMRSRVGLGK